LQTDIGANLVKLKVEDRKSYSRIKKANLNWSRTRVKFCQLIASLSVFISFLSLKVILMDLKFEFCQFKLEQNHRLTYK